MEMRRILMTLTFLACIVGLQSETLGLPVVPGCKVEVFATNIFYAEWICFDPAGVMYVAPNNWWTPESMYRITPEGQVSRFGPPLVDADGPVCDVDGSISGVPGSILVAGSCWVEPYLTAIHPDGSATQIWPPPRVPWKNPAKMAFDSTGRLLISELTIDGAMARVHQTTGAPPTELFRISVSPDGPPTMILDAEDNILVAHHRVPGQLTIGRWSPDGTPNGTLVEDLPVWTYNNPAAFGPGGTWGTDLFMITNGALLRFDSSGNATTVGTGFDDVYNDMAFVPIDGALYLPDYVAGHRILRISPLFAPATVVIQPDSLNVKSEGKWITCYIELGEDYDVANIDVSTVRLNGQVPAELQPAETGDYDNDAVTDLMVKFDRGAVQEILEVGDAVKVTVRGQLTDGTIFEGSDTIRVINPGGKDK